MLNNKNVILQIISKPLYLAVFCALLVFGCSNEDLNIAEFRGTIIEGATVNIDCEFIFQTNGGTYYVPTFLPAQFKQNGVLVFIKGEVLEELSSCSNANGDGRFIRIEQISSAN